MGASELWLSGLQNRAYMEGKVSSGFKGRFVGLSVAARETGVAIDSIFTCHGLSGAIRILFFQAFKKGHTWEGKVSSDKNCVFVTSNVSG